MSGCYCFIILAVVFVINAVDFFNVDGIIFLMMLVNVVSFVVDVAGPAGDCVSVDVGWGCFPCAFCNFFLDIEGQSEFKIQIKL